MLIKRGMPIAKIIITSPGITNTAIVFLSLNKLFMMALLYKDCPEPL